MKSSSSRLFVAGLLASAAAASAAYRDVPREHWAFREVQWVRGTGLIPKSQGARFDGSSGLTRYEMAQVLSGYMRDYYVKRDAIRAELTELEQVGTAHQAEMDELATRQRVVVERLDSGAVPVAEVPPPEVAPGAEAPRPETVTEAATQRAPASGSPGPSLAERLAAMRARIRSTREPGDPRDLRERLERR